MTSLRKAVRQVLKAQQTTEKPLAIVLAGHNGSGKSTMWRKSLADTLRMPLINADRMMLSILPEPGSDGHLTEWARVLRDKDRGWMGVAQQGVNAFVGHAMGAKVPFAMETVFSYWELQPDGSFRSKIDLITSMQQAGYFVLLFFVGLTSADLSILRVETRVADGGHAVEEETLRSRFPRTQIAISKAISVADASILVDNSRTTQEAFTVCQIREGGKTHYDIRDAAPPAPTAIETWMGVVAPRA